MMPNSNINIYGDSDRNIVKEIGAALKNIRLDKNITQQQMANRTGLDRVTISKLENGRAATLLTFVQILRVLDKLDFFAHLNEAISVSPIKVAEAMGKKRKRASIKNSTSKEYKSSW